MKRRYQTAGFLERCRRLRGALDAPAFSTDIIIGFPGETDADFEATCKVAEEAAFSRIHIFSYSPRRGTAATVLPDRVPPAVIADRRERLLDLEARLARAYFRSLLGRRLDVLVEGESRLRPGYVQGTSCRYAQVAFEGYGPALLSRRFPVIAHGIADGILLGEPQPGQLSVPRETQHSTNRDFVPARLALPQVSATKDFGFKQNFSWPSG
jgi:threonylcarbamoyladenosine tRNA methylthiotransferase MtaB